MTKFYREQKVELFYFTDPVCFHCWTHEPHLNKFLQIYDNYLDLHIIMGHADASHVRDNEEFDCLDFKEPHSLLPSKAFRVFSAVAPDKSLYFLRLIRSAIFSQQIDVSDEKNLKCLIQSLGERGGDIIERCKNGEGERRLEEDLRLSKRFTITQIPSLVMVHDGKIKKTIGDFQSDQLGDELSQLLGFTAVKSKVRRLNEELKFARRLYLSELEVLYDLEEEEIYDYVAGILDKKAIAG